MAFAINFLDTSNNKKSPGEFELPGEIIIGDFSESLKIPVGFWSKTDYIKQWVDGVNRLVTVKGDVNSALITEMYRPSKPKYPALYWALYKVSDAIFIQSYYQQLEKLRDDFVYDDLYTLMPVRGVPDYGDRYHVSEWTTSLPELREWAAKLKPVE